jgi:DNA-binding transcriptional regulator YbjK
MRTSQPPLGGATVVLYKTLVSYSRTYVLSSVKEGNAMAAGIRRATDTGGGDAVLMEAAQRLIGRGGLDNVTHRAVAGEAGVSLGAVTHHFASRDDLIDRTLCFAVTREVARLRDLVLGLQRKAFDAHAWLEALVGWYADDLKRNAETHIACYEVFLAAARNARYRAVIGELRETWRSSAELALRAAGSDDPEAHAAIFVSTLIGLLLQQLTQPRRSFKADAVAMLLELVDRLTAPAGTDAGRYVSPARRKPSR